jgi:hypothetical protein
MQQATIAVRRYLSPSRKTITARGLSTESCGISRTLDGKSRPQFEAELLPKNKAMLTVHARSDLPV